MPVTKKNNNIRNGKKTMCGKLQSFFFFFPSFSVSVLVLQRKQPCDHERCFAERKSRASKVLIAVVWLVGGEGGGSVEGSYLANLFAPAAVFTDKCSLQMKPDSLGMLLNPSTIARENATCKPCMKRERLERFRSCAG